MISSKADTTLIERDTSQYLVLLACDGVSELFTDSEVLDMIKSFVAKHSYKRELVSRHNKRTVVLLRKYLSTETVFSRQYENTKDLKLIFFFFGIYVLFTTLQPISVIICSKHSI